MAVSASFSAGILSIIGDNLDNTIEVSRNAAGQIFVNSGVVNRLTPLQKIIADGCHFNRNIRQLVENQFSTVTIEEFYGEGLPKLAGYLYRGIATKAA
ncbi:hypothetical protein [Leptolyngbya sp. 7M]|uniref:hypothetical protein n=1 Tax=Leptolyngbya sp. 7M TaxID=2812896 RepID=UPI001B8CAAB1|nr:hypothetical protein [Leptolyngbya sp. 7M]QYO63442.1 hypothetical protein JVX88_26620 [Leptolyngbya sp. 7M]